MSTHVNLKILLNAQLGPQERHLFKLQQGRALGAKATTKNEFDTDCAFYAQTSKMDSVHLQAGKDSMTRRLLLGAISTNTAHNEDRYSKGSHNELYMLTDRSAAGNALIHDQSRTINTG